MSKLPLILFVPGLRPKPEPNVHATELFRCLHEGLRRVDDALASSVMRHRECFELVAWNFPFYREHHDIAIDRPGIEAVIEQQGPTSEDIVYANSWKRRALRAAFVAADHLPFLIPRLADKKTLQHLRDLSRYVRNHQQLAQATRDLLKTPLLAAMRTERPVLLIGHSMGSVIAYDSLWELSHQSFEKITLDSLLTIGSPLGQRLVQKRLLGASNEGRDQYPLNIGRWINISAVGDLTSVDAKLANDFGEMVSLGLSSMVVDHSTYNYFRNGGHGGSHNVHAEYGYLVATETADTIAQWWRRVMP